MASIIQYDPTDPVVANKVTLYLSRANTPDYIDLPHTLINTDLSAVTSIPQQYWKVSENFNAVVEMSVDEIQAIDEILKAKTIRDSNFKINVYDASYRLQTETWYETDKGSGSYSGKSSETTYIYSGNALVSKTEITYYYDESIIFTVIHEYYQDNGKIIEKIRNI